MCRIERHQPAMGAPSTFRVVSHLLLTGAALHAIRRFKPCLFGPGVVANSRDTYGYRCSLHLAMITNPSVF
jgi:hypothetical protein